MMKWLTTCLLPRQRETKCRQNKGRGRLRQSEVFFPLPDQVAATHVVSPGIWPGLIRNRPGFRSCHCHQSVEDVNIVYFDSFVSNSEKYGIIEDCLDMRNRMRQPAIAINGHQYDYE